VGDNKRKRMPDERPSITKKLTIHYVNAETSPSRTEDIDIYIQVGLYPDTNLPGEIFVKADRMGSTISGLLDALSMSVSVALQAGVPLSWFVEKMKNLQFEPMGSTNDPKIRQATSIVDGIAKWLEYRFPPPT
jgi:ribonucleoside-diphosphate reductase alpha chain